MSFHDRKAEKRRAQLDDIESRVAEGSLTIRPMTEAERRRFGLEDADRSFRRFFFPGSRPGTRRGEEEYQRLARAVKSKTEAAVTERRIYSVEWQHDGATRRAQVGDPATAGKDDTVRAIFELRGGAGLVVATVDDAAALRVASADADVVDFAD